MSKQDQRRLDDAMSIGPATKAIILLFSVLCIAGCRNSKTGDNQNGADRSSELRPPPFSFESHLSQGAYTFDVSTLGDGSLRTMTLVVHFDDRTDTLREELDGRIVNAVTADLDMDSIPELYVFAQSAGSGSYGTLHGFQFNDRGRQSFSLPELDKRLAAGYMGHDSLWVQDSVLVRTFPVYTESDMNAAASGGTRTVEYALQRNRDGSLQLHLVGSTNRR